MVYDVPAPDDARSSTDTMLIARLKMILRVSLDINDF